MIILLLMIFKRKFVILFSGERGHLLETLPLSDEFNHALLPTIIQIAQLDAILHTTEAFSIQFNDAAVLL